SGHNRLSKIESILVNWDVPKSFTRSKTRLQQRNLWTVVSPVYPTNRLVPAAGDVRFSSRAFQA
ncbi:MAG: hypothetical protein KZQ60_02505, partial [Candidatus Thiodiazotropha sp. (ex Lucinoma aequizonata)]|nr:hypothetical protein [Candidatus Thiodiazotropha sp. (ex Lucinoma aequizonata)]